MASCFFPYNSYLVETQTASTIPNTKCMVFQRDTLYKPFLNLFTFSLMFLL